MLESLLVVLRLNLAKIHDYQQIPLTLPPPTAFNASAVAAIGSYTTC
jgi:hypothetical protein